jgi:hypothetical protein
LTKVKGIFKYVDSLRSIIHLMIILYYVCRKRRKDLTDTVAEERWLGIARN